MENMTQDQPGLPDEIRAALENVLDYCWADELKDYEATPAAERPGHVFESLRLLRGWLVNNLSNTSVDVKLLIVRGEGLGL